MSEVVRVAIVGSTGYGGVELIRLLLQHPQVQITSVISSSTAGQSIADGYPHLNQIINDALDGIDLPLIKSKADVVFLATPSGISTKLAPQFVDAGLKVIDLSGDFRLKDADSYRHWYKHEPAEQKYLDAAVYGLAELFADEVKGVAFISNPGCYATAAILGLSPAIAGGLIDPTTLIIDAKSGVSGAGRGTSLLVHYAEINENFLAYKINKHQHIPEIEMALSRVAGKPITTTFTTHLTPMTRGIMCTMYATLATPIAGETLAERAADATRVEAELLAAYAKFYEGRRFVRVRAQGKFPATKEVSGSNFCDIGISVDPRTGRVTVISVIDNVVKGAAGQAVQNLNIMYGWDEALGLHFTPVYP
jgi:N-acetyl-gamma-glutamyl-phosphate reductase